MIWNDFVVCVVVVWLDVGWIEVLFVLLVVGLIIVVFKVVFRLVVCCLKWLLECMCMMLDDSLV